MPIGEMLKQVLEHNYPDVLILQNRIEKGLSKTSVDEN